MGGSRELPAYQIIGKIRGGGIAFGVGLGFECKGGWVEGERGVFEGGAHNVEGVWVGKWSL